METDRQTGLAYTDRQQTGKKDGEAGKQPSPHNKKEKYGRKL